MSVQDIVVFPHCDLHVALNGTPTLSIRVFARDFAAANEPFKLTDVTASCLFDFFAPYNAVGNRLQAFVSIDPDTGVVTPTALGINLVQIRFPDPAFPAPNNVHAMVVRIQVHDTILGWWFGNESITTARHDTIACAQPSIYALFSTDASGTDVVGDITGHGYVTLTSSSEGVFTVDPATGRLRGVMESGAQLSGEFLGIHDTLPVRVIDYAKARQTLQAVRSADRTNPQAKHNIVFLPEGFRNTVDDRDRFDEIVAKTVDQMFSKPRHAPYNILSNNFNVWKAFEPSQQHALTCAYRVNDEVPGVLGAKYPIPLPQPVSTVPTNYQLDELVPIVGLPLRTESRDTAQLKALWSSQSLDNFKPERVDDRVGAVWKAQRSVGILEARDTVFGLRLGGRFADRSSRFVVVLPPASDSTADPALKPFVKQMYEWFRTPPARELDHDPRRHPPELYGGAESLADLILTYIDSLRDAEAPHAHVGPEWVPVQHLPAGFKRSRGLVVIIANDALTGGANINASTATTTTINSFSTVAVGSDDSGNRRVRRRTPPDPIPMDLQDCIDTVAHELGHSFNLGDEYEDFPGDEPSTTSSFDNITVLAQINLDANFATNRKLDPAKVKWFELVRIRVSDTLTQPSAAVGAQMRVAIDPGHIGKWVKAKEKNLEANLRNIDLPGNAGRQLPQPSDAAHHLVRLTIGTIDAAAGTILLGGPAMPATPPQYPAGSLLYIPVRDSAGDPVKVVEKKVLQKLTATHLPLNQDTDTTKINREADNPVDIDDFKPPCKSYKLIGVFEGADHVTGMAYRPAGLCKMRKQGDAGPGDGEFCHVCKYLIVSRVDPAQHGLLDEKYYPTAKKNG